MDDGISPTEKTAKRMEAFLEALAEVGSVRHASEASHLPRTYAYELRASSEAFAARWKDALADSADVLEQEARRRATKGVADPVVYRGKLCYRTDPEGNLEHGPDGSPIPLVVTKYSDVLLIALLNANNPDKFKYRAEVKQTQVDKEDEPVADLTDGQLRNIIDRASRALDDLERRKDGGAGAGESDGGSGASSPVH